MMQTSGRIAAVVVLYHPDEQALFKNMRRLEGAVDRVILVDNSGTGARAYQVLGRSGRVRHVNVGFNSGVGAALNVGVAAAKQEDCEYIICLDQDSALDVTGVKSLASRFLEIERSGVRIGGMGPDPINARDGARLGAPITPRNRRLFGPVRRRDEVITSGFFTSVEVLEDVGPFMEGLFIDFVDFEWCWRARSRGYVLGVDESVRMDHHLGARDARMLWRKVQVEAPIRNYYQYRNYLLVARLPHCSRYFLARQACSLLARLALLPFQGGERRERARYIARGLWDGVCGVEGHMPQRSEP